MGKVLKADGSVDSAYVERNLGSDQSDVWDTFNLGFDSPAVALWADAASGYECLLYHTPGGSDDGLDIAPLTFPGTPGWQGYWMDPSDPVDVPAVAAGSWHLVEIHHVNGGTCDYYIDGTLIGSGPDGALVGMRYVGFGLFSPTPDPASVVYVSDVKIGTTRGASDLFSDNFSSGDLSAWTSTSGDVSVVDDPFGPPPPPPTPIYSVTYDGNGSDGGTAPVDAASPYTARARVVALWPGDLTLTGYAFARWNTAADGSGTTYHRRSSFKMPAGDLTLYAQWVVPPVPMGPGRRVGIAFDSGPLDVLTDEDYTWLDDESVFPASFVTGYDTKNGRQGLISQTETGTATVYVNDNKLGLFDDRNTDSPYHGKLSGKQILLQLWDPVALAWEKQFGGWVDDHHYDIDGSAVKNLWDAPEDRQPINASIQIECVDMFERLAGFGLTPGLAGDRPLSGMEDGVYYAEATVQGRQIEILADVGIPPEMRGPEDDSGVGDIAEGNVHVIAVKYDPDESALAALRDAVDAEFPFLGNAYCDRRGRYQFHGRYGRIQPGHGGDPDAPAGVSDEDGSHWDFHRWKVGDGAAIAADPDRAQMRVLAFEHARSNVINAGLCYPQGIAAADMRNQVYADSTSIDDYGKHDAPPMSDLLTADDLLVSGMPNAKRECFKFAKLHVKNQKDPRESITALQVKAIRPTDARAEKTWAFITTSDIGHIVNVAGGYPGGTGFVGNSPEDDYYIEGRTLRVRPLTPEFDYVEYDVNVSPAVWSMDTHGVFPPLGGPSEAPIRAEFDVTQTDTATFAVSDISTPGPSGPITAWAWDFGDGGTATGQFPTAHVYGANGTYLVTLTVTGTGGDGTDEESRLLKVTGL